MKDLTDGQSLEVIMQIASQMTSDDAKDPAIMHYKACRRYSDIYAPLLSERSPVSKMMGSVQIPARIDSVEYEPSTTRYIVRFTPFGKDAKPEHVRTERTDGLYGEVVRRYLRIQEGGASGTRSVLWAKNLTVTPLPSPSGGYPLKSRGGCSSPRAASVRGLEPVPAKPAGCGRLRDEEHGS